MTAADPRSPSPLEGSAVAMPLPWVLQALGLAALACDPQGRVLFANTAFGDLLQLDAPALQGRPVGQALMALGESARQQILQNDMARALRAESPLPRTVSLHLPEQATLRLQIRCAPLGDSHTRPVGALLLLNLEAVGTADQGRDGAAAAGATAATTTLPAPPERAGAPASSLEERVLQRTAQLKQAHDEMEAFAYSVSHDLRTPLSAIDGFSSLLEHALEDLPDELARDARRYLSRIRSGVHHMGDLIEALLSLARLSRVPLQVLPVDLSRLASEVLQALHERDPGRAVELTVQPGLTARGDPRLLKQLLENLLGNAWKFSNRQALTRIAFGRDEATGAYFVRDNGAGFDMAHAQRLFNPFQRLHTPAEFEGTGIGLATVRRIVSRHGGEVRGVAQPDQGAIFCFTLDTEKAAAQAVTAS